MPSRPRIQPLTDSQRKLAEDYIPFAISLARNHNPRVPLDDRERAALWGLVRAAARFDPHRGVKFATFSRDAIIGELNHATPPPLRPTHHPVDPTPTSSIDAESFATWAMNHLLQSQRSLFKAYWIEGRSLTSIAREKRVAKSSIHRRLNRILAFITSIKDSY